MLVAGERNRKYMTGCVFTREGWRVEIAVATQDMVLLPVGIGGTQASTANPSSLLLPFPSNHHPPNLFPSLSAATSAMSHTTYRRTPTPSSTHSTSPPALPTPNSSRPFTPRCLNSTNTTHAFSTPSSPLTSNSASSLTRSVSSSPSLHPTPSHTPPSSPPYPSGPTTSAMRSSSSSE